MTESHSLGLRASSMGHRDQLNHFETPPRPLLSNTLTQVRGYRNEHQGKPWGKRAQRATVKVGVSWRREECRQAAQRVAGQGHLLAESDV